MLLPLISFWIILILGPRLGKHGSSAGYVATGAILGSLLLVLIAASIWLGRHAPVDVAHHGEHTTEPVPA